MRVAPARPRAAGGRARFLHAACSLLAYYLTGRAPPCHPPLTPFYHPAYPHPPPCHPPQEAEEYFSKWGDSGVVDLMQTFSDLIILTASRTLLGARQPRAGRRRRRRRRRRRCCCCHRR